MPDTGNRIAGSVDDDVYPIGSNQCSRVLDEADRAFACGFVERFGRNLRI